MFRQVAGEIRDRVVAPGDTLISLAGELGVPWRTLAEENRLADPGRLKPGEVVRADTRRIVPHLLDEGIVVNIPEAALYCFEGGALSARYRLGLGSPNTPTPTGSFTVLLKQSQPDRGFPRSLAQERAREAKVVETKAPPRPDAPLGTHWIELSPWECGIHGTPFASSLGRFLSQRCIRVPMDQMQDLFSRVQQGTRVEFVYAPVKLAVTGGGEIWAEAHPDVYGMGSPGLEAVLAALRQYGAVGVSESEALTEILRSQAGVARMVRAASVQPAHKRIPDAAKPPEDLAAWRCRDCPPGPTRRVTFQIEARAPIDLPNPFPIEVRDDTGAVIFRPQMLVQTRVRLEPGETRNFVWEVRDNAGQPLAPGSYSVAIRFFAGPSGTEHTLSLPLWLGK